MKTRARFLILGLGVLAIVPAGAAATASSRAATGSAARLSVRSTEFGKALFGPTTERQPRRTAPP